MSPFPKVKHKLRNGKSRAAKNLQHMPRNDRQGKRNPRVSLKPKVINTFSQLNPDKDKNFQFPSQLFISLNLGHADVFAKQFRFGAQEKLTPT